ncbi:MAG: capsular biosynthesis protein [Raineya sp.]|nr:capsular biosynthesis protein [Raineya sp.]
MKKVAFFTTYTLTPHYETELEIMQRHLEGGDLIYQIYCEYNFKSCTSNPEHRENLCNICITKRKRGIRMLNSKIKEIGLFQFLPKNIKNNLKSNFTDLEELRNYSIDNFDIGMGVLSTLISYLRTPYFDIKDYQTYVKANIESAYQTYLAAVNLLSKQNFDIVYIFNGRFTIERAILRACEKVGQRYYTHERGCNRNHYEIFENTLPHSIIYNHNKMLEAWNKETNEEKKKKIADNFFLSRINKTWEGYEWMKALDSQDPNLLPDNWDNKKYNIVIFNTSDNEFVAIGEEYKQNIFSTQLEGIKEIAHFIREINDSSIQLYLRMHPMLANSYKEAKHILKELEPYRDVLHIIPPTSPVSSYKVLFNCDKVITFGSSIGIEATYHGKPSISLASSGYQYLDVVYLPKTREELWNLLLDRNLAPKDSKNTLIYAYYYETVGIPYKYYQAETLFSGKFKGEVLEGINVRLTKMHLFKQNVKRIINTIVGKSIFEIYV